MIIERPTGPRTGPLNEWHGITTDLNGRVTELRLSGSRLCGTIPAELGNLSELTVLDLSNNKCVQLGGRGIVILSTPGLSGQIPASLGNLENLEVLNLNRNQLTGPIPAELTRLKNLEWLSLSRNKLGGEISASLVWLTKMTKLYLYDNELKGKIPASLGHLSNLKSLYLHNNRLDGEIPGELGNLKNLEVLNLSNNRLSEPIPASLGSASSLRQLNLRDNQLSGAIPTTLSARFGLEEIETSGVGHLSRLTHLNLRGNDLDGTIPTNLSLLANLEMLSLSQNQLTGSIPAALGELENLTHLYLYDNNLTGVIPTELYELDLVVFSYAGNPNLGTPSDNPVAEICPGSEKGIENDLKALQALFAATDGRHFGKFYGDSSWTSRDGWSTDASSYDGWYGVEIAECDPNSPERAGRVTAINLSNNGLDGSIDALTRQIDDLISKTDRETDYPLYWLQSLDISNNSADSSWWEVTRYGLRGDIGALLTTLHHGASLDVNVSGNVWTSNSWNGYQGTISPVQGTDDILDVLGALRDGPFLQEEKVRIVHYLTLTSENLAEGAFEEIHDKVLDEGIDLGIKKISGQIGTKTGGALFVGFLKGANAVWGKANWIGWAHFIIFERDAFISFVEHAGYEVAKFFGLAQLGELIAHRYTEDALSAHVNECKTASPSTGGLYQSAKCDIAIYYEKAKKLNGSESAKHDLKHYFMLGCHQGPNDLALNDQVICAMLTTEIIEHKRAAVTGWEIPEYWPFVSDFGSKVLGWVR